MSKRKRGAQLGNLNAAKHLAYSKKFTPTSPQGRLVQWIEAKLIEGIPDPSPQEALILKRAAVKAFRCHMMEKEILRRDGDLPESLGRDYLSWSKSLREDLRLLGLKRRSKNITDITVMLAEEAKAEEGSP